MKDNTQRVLKLVADYEAFCAGDAENSAAFDDGELSAAELDLIAAAGTNPSHTQQKPDNRKQ